MKYNEADFNDNTFNVIKMSRKYGNIFLNIKFSIFTLLLNYCFRTLI